MKERLQRRLRNAQQILRELKSQYDARTEFYTDQIAYIKALKDHLAAL